MRYAITRFHKHAFITVTLLACIASAPTGSLAQCLACGLSNLGNSVNAIGQQLFQQELQKEQQDELLREQQQQQMEQLQRQRDLELQRQRATKSTSTPDAGALAHLAQTYPNWPAIVGAPARPGEPPDMNAPFRKWLLTKPTDYQALINSTNSPTEVEAAITLFFAEIKRAQ